MGLHPHLDIIILVHRRITDICIVFLVINIIGTAFTACLRFLSHFSAPLFCVFSQKDSGRNILARNLSFLQSLLFVVYNRTKIWFQSSAAYQSAVDIRLNK